MSPDDDGRSPIILGQVGSGKVTVGDDVTNPLTAGEEYFFYFRTSSFAGLKSNPIEIVKSLPIDTITANNRLVGSTAYFEIRVESGVGSFIRVKFVDDFPKTLEEADTPFRYSKLSHSTQRKLSHIILIRCYPKPEKAVCKRIVDMFGCLDFVRVVSNARNCRKVLV